VYGTGGKEFFVEDAEALLREAAEIAKSERSRSPTPTSAPTGRPVIRAREGVRSITEAQAPA